jgi:hypothetical protein
MFLGHFALGFALKRLEPRVSLATGILAAQLADTVWPVLVLAGIEHVTVAPGDTAVTPLRFDSYPWSHSLVALAGWAALFGALHFAVRRRVRAALLLAALVVSHWVLDWISHRADMPLAPGSDVCVGLGLWNSVPATLVVELAMFAGGVAIAETATRPRDRVGSWGLWGLVALLAAAYVGNLLGPPPPSTAAVAWTSVLLPAILLPLFAWVDHHRTPTAS